jgi:hypothetical protein
LQFGFVAKSVLQKLEVRDPVPIERHEFAIDHRIPCDAFERFGDFDVVVADDLAITAVERDLAAFVTATMRKPSYLSSNIQFLSSNGASVSVASIGCRRFGSVVVRATMMCFLQVRCEM